MQAAAIAGDRSLHDSLGIAFYRQFSSHGIDLYSVKMCDGRRAPSWDSYNDVLWAIAVSSLLCRIQLHFSKEHEVQPSGLLCEAALIIYIWSWYPPPVQLLPPYSTVTSRPSLLDMW